MLVGMQNNWNSRTLVLGMQNGAATLVISYKDKHASRSNLNQLEGQTPQLHLLGGRTQENVPHSFPEFPSGTEPQLPAEEIAS